MDALAHFKPCVVEIDDVTHGGREIDALRYGDFAIDDRTETGRWVITHVPTGLGFRSVGGVFSRPELAARAVMELQGIRNNWALIDIETARDRALQSEVEALLKRHGGEVQFGSGWDPETLSVLRNGYEAA